MNHNKNQRRRLFINLHLFWRKWDGLDQHHYPTLKFQENNLEEVKF